MSFLIITESTYVKFEYFGYFGETMPALSVKTCHFERCCNDTKN